MVAKPKVGSVQELAINVRKHPELEQMLKDNPAEALDSLARSDVPNTFVYQVVVVSLGVAMIVALLGSIFLVWYDKTTPDIAIAIGSAAVGALAGLLAPAPG